MEAFRFYARNSSIIDFHNRCYYECTLLHFMCSKRGSSIHQFYLYSILNFFSYLPTIWLLSLVLYFSSCLNEAKQGKMNVAKRHESTASILSWHSSPESLIWWRSSIEINITWYFAERTPPSRQFKIRQSLKHSTWNVLRTVTRRWLRTFSEASQPRFGKLNAH
jgi:hypothetical protein